MFTQSACAIIIVTNNSEKHIHYAVKCLEQQTVLPAQIIIVDSGSNDTSYLDQYHQRSNITVFIGDKDIGFCKGNNIGMKHVASNCDYIFFLNPDAFLTPSFLEQAIAFMEAQGNEKCAALTGTILGYDIEANKPKNAYDTTGIFRTWYGRWYDRNQGEEYREYLFQTSEPIPAICGAVLFCRKKALDTIMLPDSKVFDETFYMYKEDIDLCLRLRQKGWSLSFVPYLKAFHCRGWQRDRSKMARKFRLASALNELKIQMRLLSPAPIAYSLLKYAAVKILDK